MPSFKISPQAQDALKGMLEHVFQWLNSKNKNSDPVNWIIHVYNDEIILEIDADFLRITDEDRQQLMSLNSSIGFDDDGHGGTKLHLRIRTDHSLDDLTGKIQAIRAELESQLKNRNIPVGF